MSLKINSRLFRLTYQIVNLDLNSCYEEWNERFHWEIITGEPRIDTSRSSDNKLVVFHKLFMSNLSRFLRYSK